MKTDWEIEAGIKFSKNGIIKAVETILAYENNQNLNDPNNSKLWEEKLKNKTMAYFLKKKGSHLSEN